MHGCFKAGLSRTQSALKVPQGYHSYPSNNLWTLIALIAAILNLAHKT